MCIVVHLESYHHVYMRELQHHAWSGPAGTGARSVLRLTIYIMPDCATAASDENSTRILGLRLTDFGDFAYSASPVRCR